MSARYEALPTSDEDQYLIDAETAPSNINRIVYPPDPRFDRPTPSPYARAALLIFMAFLFWLAFALRKATWMGELKASDYQDYVIF